MLRERMAAYGRLEEEFRQERAAALGRIGRTLEGHLATLRRLRVAWREAPGGARAQLTAQYADVHSQAMRYRWYLEVQREAIGLRRHERLDEQYRVPPASIDAPGNDRGGNPGFDPGRGAQQQPQVEDSMGLRDTYAYAIQTAKGKFDGSAVEKDGKLHWSGTVKSEADKNEIWSALKTIPSWKDDIVADIRVVPGAAPAAAPARTYTVKPGDTLGGIAKSQLGQASDYMKIFELNKDQLSDPDKIKPGQVLKLP